MRLEYHIFSITMSISRDKYSDAPILSHFTYEFTTEAHFFQLTSFGSATAS